MAEVTHEQVPTNGIKLHVAVAGPADGPPVVLCHGFPEIWYSWRHQLGALADAGYRAVRAGPARLRRERGPPEVTAYGSDNLTADLGGLLDHYGYDQAAFVGHDWGAMVVWEMGRLHPGRVASLFNYERPVLQRAGAAHPDLRGDLREQVLLHALLPAGRPGRGGVRGGPAPLPPDHALLGRRRGDVQRHCPSATSPARAPGSWTCCRRPPTSSRTGSPKQDVDVYAAAFKQSGFFGPVSFYRNMDANWARSKDIPPSVYTMPTGFVTGSLDPVNTMMPGAIEEMAEALPDFRGATVVDGAGHWVQQERPAETNAALLSFLASV